MPQKLGTANMLVRGQPPVYFWTGSDVLNTDLVTGFKFEKNVLLAIFYVFLFGCPRSQGSRIGAYISSGMLYVGLYLFSNECSL